MNINKNINKSEDKNVNKSKKNGQFRKKSK